MFEVIGGLVLFFLLFTLVMVWLGIRLARRAVRRVRGMIGGLAQSGSGMTAFAEPRWLRLATLLDRRQRDQARLARERIAALLAERGSAALTPDEAQLMISCEKRVPELIDACLDRCRTARSTERCDYAGPTLERLVRIGEEADAARRAIRARDDGRLLTIHSYFDSVVPERSDTRIDRSAARR